MDVKLKQRLIGALVLGALAVIFVPMIVIGPESKGAADAADVPITVPDAPEGEFVTREIPLGPPVASPSATPGPAQPQVVIPANPADPNALATVDATANVAPRVDVLAAEEGLAVDAATGQPVPAAATPTAVPTPAPVATETVAAAPAAVPAPVAEPAAPTPVPSPVAAPVAPAAVAAGDYEVTAGSFGNRANADALVARLKSSGLPAYTEPTSINGQPATRVKVGPFADRAAAEAARVRTAAISGSAAVATGDAAPTSARSTTPAPRPAASTPPPAAAAPAPAPSSGSGFAVQLGAFASQADAQALVARARAAGFASFEQRVPTANGVLWRVRLGPAADRSAAEQMKSDAAGKLGVSGLVVPHP